MLHEHARAAVGCLLIDDDKPGMPGLSGLCSSLAGRGIRADVFSLTDEPNLHEHLQTAYYEIRRRCDVPTIVAAGPSCWTALALAVQLPAERLALIDPAFRAGRDGSPCLPRAQARMRTFAARNLSFCTGDVLIACRRAEDLPAALHRLRAVRGRLAGVVLPREWRYEIGRTDVSWLSDYLLAGELPKSLAENPEMCIIYG